MNLERQSIHDSVYWKLRQALQAGAFAPGQKLTNRYLAQTIGYSITPVREAIRRLVSQGALIELPSGSVTAPDVDVDQFLNETAWLLLTLGSRAASLAMPRLTAGDIVTLETTFEQARLACQRGEPEKASARYRDFYFLIFERAQQPILLSLLDMLWLRASALDQHVSPTFFKQEGGRHYREMIDAARKRDASGAVLALAGFYARLESYLRATPTNFATPVIARPKQPKSKRQI